MEFEPRNILKLFANFSDFEPEYSYNFIHIKMLHSSKKQLFATHVFTTNNHCLQTTSSALSLVSPIAQFCLFLFFSHLLPHCLLGVCHPPYQTPSHMLKTEDCLRKICSSFGVFSWTGALALHTWTLAETSLSPCTQMYAFR